MEFMLSTMNEMIVLGILMVLIFTLLLWILFRSISAVFSVTESVSMEKSDDAFVTVIVGDFAYTCKQVSERTRFGLVSLAICGALSLRERNKFRSTILAEHL